jgi:putative endonuclease
MNFVYILISENKNNWSYVGCTANLKQRFKDHQAGKVKSTKGYRLLKLIYDEECSDKNEARRRELFLKSGFGREEKSEILKNILK